VSSNHCFPKHPIQRKRTRLRADPGLIAAYVAAKRAILADGCTDPIDYCNCKGEFVTAALRQIA